MDNLQNETLSAPVKSGRTMVVGVFTDKASAERAYNQLNEHGYTKDEINLVMSDETRKKHFSDKTDKTELSTKAVEGGSIGSAIGGTIGAITGIIAAIGTSLVIPGLGFVIAGPLAAGLAGAGAGGITGGIIGALVGAGIPEVEAKRFEADVKGGKIVMGVNPKNDADVQFVENALQSNKARVS